jgi:hypothetical protein
MSLLDYLRAVTGTAISETSIAHSTMRRINPNALCGWEGRHPVYIEDHTDPDGRMFRLEYRCDAEGRNAVAYCRYNPWGRAAHSIHQSHLFGDGRICLGSRAFTLEEAVLRARYWCTAYSVLRETGHFPG